MLRSLEIQNFKGIKQGKIEDLAQVNILVGRNNSGKSTILDALVLLRCAVVSNDYVGTNGLEQIIKRRVDRGNPNYDELWFRLNTNSPLILSADFTDRTEVKEEWRSNRGGNPPGGKMLVPVGPTEFDIHPNMGFSAKSYGDYKFWRDLNGFIGQADATYLALVHILDTTSIHYPFAEKLWPDLVKDRKDDKVRQILEGVYGIPINYITSMRFPTEERLVAALPHAGLAVDWLGDGFRYAVNILALGVLLKGTALLVEELETHQHPESLRKLTQALFELAKEQDLQLFLTTHSLELIDYAMDAAQERGIDLNLYHLNLDKEGVLKATPFPRPDAKLLLDIGHDPRLHYKYITAK